MRWASLQGFLGLLCREAGRRPALAVLEKKAETLIPLMASSAAHMPECLYAVGQWPSPTLMLCANLSCPRQAACRWTYWTRRWRVRTPHASSSSARWAPPHPPSRHARLRLTAASLCSQRLHVLGTASVAIGAGCPHILKLRMCSMFVMRGGCAVALAQLDSFVGLPKGVVVKCFVALNLASLHS